MTGEQYALLCARRQNFDALLWQTPPLAIAAQSFLLSTAFDGSIGRWQALLLGLFSAWVGLASFQLMVKHRHHERLDANRLEAFENDRAEYAVLHEAKDNAPIICESGREPPSWLARLQLRLVGRLLRIRSFTVWSALMLGFPCLGMAAAVAALLR